MDRGQDRTGPLELVIFDVDGVMTDGRIVIDDSGLESKFFHVRDGHGIKLLMYAGLKVAILTGRQSRVVTRRAEELGIGSVYQGVKNKIQVYEQIRAQFGLNDQNIAFAGDDLVDIPVMKRVGLAMAPADAVREVRAISHFVAGKKGGKGAVREMAEFVLKGKGIWEKIMEGLI